MLSLSGRGAVHANQQVFTFSVNFFHVLSRVFALASYHLISYAAPCNNSRRLGCVISAPFTLCGVIHECGEV
jgi:hypothetical protein